MNDLRNNWVFAPMVAYIERRAIVIVAAVIVAANVGVILVALIATVLR